MMHAALNDNVLLSMHAPKVTHLQGLRTQSHVVVARRLRAASSSLCAGSPTPTPYRKSDFKQCGGSGNKCSVSPKTPLHRSWVLLLGVGTVP